jgi:hypothetical protein
MADYWGRFSCQVTPKRSATQQNNSLKMSGAVDGFDRVSADLELCDPNRTLRFGFARPITIDLDDS